MHTSNPFKDQEDRLQFAKALDRLKEAQAKNRATFTDFLNPQRGAVFLQQLAKINIHARLYGGYDEAERVILGISPNSGETKEVTKEETEHTLLAPESFPILPIAITYNTRFSKQLTHRDFLGAVLGLGLDRCVIGDIRIGTTGAIMYVSEAVAGFITESLKDVGRTTVTATIYKEATQKSTTNDETTKGRNHQRKAAKNEVQGIETPGTQKRITAASLRLDAVISASLRLSRGKATALIEAEKVFVNWMPAKKTYQLKEGDIVTLRQVGRLRLDCIQGATKKDRVALVITLF